MSHFPVDHPLRGFYRGLAFLIGVALIVFGVVGYLRTSDLAFFDQHGERVLGLTTNPAFAIASIVMGALIAVIVAIGRNLDAVANMAFGTVFMLVGLAALCVIRTDDLNFLAFSITNVAVSFVIGTVLLLAGLYGAASRSHSRPAAGQGQRAKAAAGAH